MHTPIEFYLKVPEDLFRKGTPKKPKFDYLRTSPPREAPQVFDVKVKPVAGRLIIEPKTGGLSLFDAPGRRAGEDWWVVQRGVALPHGFTISKDLTDGVFRGHYTVHALKEIDVDTWKKTLGEWAEEHAIHIDEYRRRRAQGHV